MTLKTLLRTSCFAFLVFGSGPVCAQSKPDEGRPTVEHAQIQATIDANNAAVSAKDMNGILATYETSATMVGPRGAVSEGVAALREAFAQFLAADPKITVTNSQIVRSHDIALHSYTWSMSGKMPNGQAFQQNGLSVIVLRRQPDGRWLIVIDDPFADALLKGPQGG
jgi:uncharacterized protein (TIGR02246 family)